MLTFIEYLTEQSEETNPLKQLKDVYRKHSSFIGSIHKNSDLTFKYMSLSDFNKLTKYMIYKSPVYNNRQSSEYHIAAAPDGNLLFVRKSNHWGRFSTNVYSKDDDVYKLNLGTVIPDEYGRVGWRNFHWKLIGGNENSNSSQAGFLILKDLNPSIQDMILTSPKKPSSQEKMILDKIAMMEKEHFVLSSRNNPKDEHKIKMLSKNIDVLKKEYAKKYGIVTI